MSLLIPIPFGFQYTRRGPGGHGHISSIAAIGQINSAMHPFGRSYPLPDNWMNLVSILYPFTFVFNFRTSAAFLHWDSLLIGLLQGFPAAESEYEWILFESFPRYEEMCQNVDFLRLEKFTMCINPYSWRIKMNILHTCYFFVSKCNEL